MISKITLAVLFLLMAPLMAFPPSRMAPKVIPAPAAGGGGGGGGGPFVFVKSVGTRNSGSGTTLTAQLLTVTAGNVIIAWVKHEEAPTTLTVSDGTSTFTPATKVNHGNNDLSSQFHYLLASVASGTVTYTATFAAAKGFRSFVVFEFDPTATAAFDTEPTGGGASGSGGTLSSGNMTTTVNDGLVLGAYGNYGSETFTTMAINGVAAAGIQGDDGSTTTSQTGGAVWYRIPTATFTGAATGTGVTGSWILNAIAIK